MVSEQNENFNKERESIKTNFGAEECSKWTENPLEKFNIRLDQAEDRISEIENRSLLSIQVED